MSISTASTQVATLSRYRYVATGGETSVTGVDANGNVLVYAVGMEQVYLNGVLLVRGGDYTASTGTSITALAALVASDVVEVLTFSPFTVLSESFTVVNNKGDLIVGTADNTVTNVPVGADATASGRLPQELYPDATTASGVRWGDDYLILTAMQAI